MRGPGRVGPDQDGVEHQGGVVTLFVAEGVFSGQASHGALEEFEVVVGVVGCGVARSQHGGEGLVGVVAPHRQGTEPEAVLIRGRGVLLFCMHVEQGRVEVPDHRADRWLRRPDTRPGRRHRDRDSPQLDQKTVACTRPRSRSPPKPAKRSSCSLSAAMSARQSAPSAMATARWVSTTPGSWVCQLTIDHGLWLLASSQPLRSASSAKSAAPAWDTRFLPSGITLARRTSDYGAQGIPPGSGWMSAW